MGIAQNIVKVIDNDFWLDYELFITGCCNTVVVPTTCPWYPLVAFVDLVTEHVKYIFYIEKC